MQKLIDAVLLRALPAAVVLFAATSAHAVKPASFTHTTEADFADGDNDATVVTNLGDLKLSSDTESIEGLPEDVTVIHDILTIGDTTYIAAGPEAKLLKLSDGKVQVVKTYEGEQVFTLGEYSPGRLLVGISAGENSRIEAMRADGPEAWLNLPDTRYIWDLQTVMLEGDKLQGLAIATGPEGKLLYLDDGEDKPKTLLELSQANILSLATDSKGNIYAGTDTDGLIYRINPNGKPFVVYDAPEAEVSALVVMDDGTLYAGTSAADQAKPGRLAQPVKKEEGRPVPPEEAEEQVQSPEQPGPEVEEPKDPAEEPEQPAEAQAKPKPNAEQYDALRKELRERLEEARESGSLTGEGGSPVALPNKANKPGRPSLAKPAAPAQRKKGNAIYRIAPDGFVSEVFRESAMILAIVPHDGKLIVATGNEGQVYSVDPQRNETTVLTDLDSAQVTSAVQTDKGLMLGAANPGALMLMSTEVASEGTYTSRVLDAGQVSLYGMFKITADIPKGISVKVEMRSGNIGDPELAAWSKWSAPATLPADPDANPLQPREIMVSVHPARYLQYRLTLTSKDTTTPIIDQVDIAYVAPNTPPVVHKLIAKPAAVKPPGNDPDPKVTIQWQATDGNKDRLTYAVQYKPGKADRYLPLAEDLTAAKYEWMTQHVPDGWYTVRVTAYDKLDNPATSAKTGGRISEPLLIDNTPPALKGLKAVVKDGNVVLSAKVSDKLSPISSVAYSIDGSDQYQASLPEDLIYDSTSEAWGVTISDLSKGGHVIAVRAIDAKGNTAYRQLIVDVQ